MVVLSQRVTFHYRQRQVRLGRILRNHNQNRTGVLLVQGRPQRLAQLVPTDEDTLPS
jgi:hypothetical protein